MPIRKEFSNRRRILLGQRNRIIESKGDKNPLKPKKKNKK